MLARRDLSYHGPYKKLGNAVLSGWASLWAGNRLHDVESGYRIFRLGSLAHALDFYTGYKYSETVEVAVVMSRLGYRVRNDHLVPVPVSRSRTRLRDAVIDLAVIPVAAARVWRREPRAATTAPFGRDVAGHVAGVLGGRGAARDRARPRQRAAWARSLLADARRARRRRAVVRRIGAAARRSPARPAARRASPRGSCPQRPDLGQRGRARSRCSPRARRSPRPRSAGRIRSCSRAHRAFSSCLASIARTRRAARSPACSASSSPPSSRARRPRTRPAGTGMRTLAFGTTLVIVTVGMTGYFGASTVSAQWFGGGVTHGPRNSGEVAITFDDEPNANATPAAHAHPRRRARQGDYEGNPIPPTGTATPLPSPTPGASGINLVASQLEMLGPYGHRISRQYPVTFNVTVRNEGTTAAPAGSPIEADVFTGLSRPPQPGDQSATFGRVVLPQALAPGQQVVVTMPWQPTAAGTLSLYAWVNRNNLVPETLYTDNVMGPNTSCVYATDGQSFSDVPLTVYFYTPVEYLACQGVISGYNNGDGTFSFRPYNNTTRGQFSKMISLASGWSLVNPTTPTFRDVAPTSTFYTFIETAYSHGVISGYACGTGCLEFRPGANITRGQLAKIVALSKGWTLVSPPTATFRDVAVGSAFYAFVETVYSKNVVSGYACGTGCLESARAPTAPAASSPR